MQDKFYIEVKDFSIPASTRPTLSFTLVWGVQVEDKVFATSWRHCIWRMLLGDQGDHANRKKPREGPFENTSKIKAGTQKWYPPYSIINKHYKQDVKVTPDLYDLVLTKLKESGKEKYLYERWAKWLKRRVMVEQIKRGEMNL